MNLKMYFAAMAFFETYQAFQQISNKRKYITKKFWLHIVWFIKEYYVTSDEGFKNLQITRFHWLEQSTQNSQLQEKNF